MEAALQPLQKFYQTIWPEISEQEFKMLADAHKLEVYKRGELLLKPGEVCNWIGIIAQGVVRQYVVSEGKEHVGQIFMAGQAVSDYSSYYLQRESRLYIDAVKETHIFKIERKDIEQIIRVLPRYLQLQFDYLSRTFISNFDRTISLLLDSAETRYLKLMKERPDVLQQVPLYMVASYLGITPEALSRVRHKIAQTGV